MGKTLALRITVATIVGESEAETFVDLADALVEALGARGIECALRLKGKEVDEPAPAKALDPTLN